jgi:hypothetical protein
MYVSTKMHATNRPCSCVKSQSSHCVCAGFVICHMVWLSHQNIRHTQVGLDPRPGSSVVSALGIYLGDLGGPRFKSRYGHFSCTLQCPGYITRDTEFAGFTPNLFFFKMAQDRKRCNHADITTRLHIDFQNPTSCRVCRAGKHKAISLDFKVISSYKKKKKSRNHFRNRLRKAAISSTVNYPIVTRQFCGWTTNSLTAVYSIWQYLQFHLDLQVCVFAYHHASRRQG